MPALLRVPLCENITPYFQERLRMSKTFKFKTSAAPSTSYPDAEALFRDLKNRDARIQHLWSHQADIIRSYHDNANTVDIALELPTGAGKTLVGLLIGEWRRLSNNQRVVYLCPTKQLAYQVGEKADEYGIKVHVLVGPQNQYPAGHYSDYASATAIAITTYSGLFNTNPRIDNPQTIVFDDAHAGENYIGKMWSLLISRFDNKALYDQVVDLFAADIPEYLLSTLKDDNPSPHQKQTVDLLPGTRFSQKLRPFTDLLDASTQGNDLDYPWQLIRHKLNACYAFFAWSEILIRPWVAPTLTHTPFANAVQRIYMSATLGASGELERIIGVPSIRRVPVPQGWDKQSTGRRLFVFPDRSFSSTAYEPWLTEIIGSKERTLVLTPHNLALRSFKDNMGQFGLGHQILGSQDVEESLEPFTGATKTVLALTNRYDGIDLPGDTCRVLIVFGLPTAVHLQERFLWSKLGLTSVLKDRIRTRITQAVGRCTRNSTDYATVIMVGENLFDFCINRENRSDLHPELRAEMEFGIDNSDQKKIDDLTELIELFLSRDSSWKAAEADIAKRRDETAAVVPAFVSVFRGVVHLEVGYQYDLWKEDYNSALVKATTIIDRLSGDEVAGYRALWNYFAGCSAHQLALITKDKNLVQTSSDRFYRASQAVRSVSWFARLAHELGSRPTDEARSNYLSLLAGEFLDNYLMNLGTVGAKFDKSMAEYGSLIRDSAADKFDRGLTELGKMLGFDSEKPEGAGTPDSTWRIAGGYVLLFESKSDESPQGRISITTCRQSQGHQQWVRARPFFTQNAKLLTIIITPRDIIDKDALPHAENLFYVHIDIIREIFRDVEGLLRLIRSKIVDLETEQRRQLIQAELVAAKLTPAQVIQRLTSIRVIDLPQK